jgi:hypothetical protein
MGVARFVIFLMAGAFAHAAAPLAARWEGVVRIPGRELPLVIDLAQDAGGHWIGSAIFPGLGAKGTPLTAIAVKEANVEFAIHGALGDPNIKAKLTAAGALSGEFLEAGNTAEFTLHRAGPPQVDLPPQSTPVEKAVEGEWFGDLAFFGGQFKVKLTLTNKDGKGTGQFVLTRARDNPFAADVVMQDGAQLTIEMLEPQLEFEGRIKLDASEIAGAFRQGANEAPLILHRRNAQ